MNKELMVTIRVPLQESLLSDILCTALEGGINYWCSLTEITRDEAHIDYLSAKAWDAEDDSFLGCITHETIVKGINLVLDEDTKVSSAVRSSVEKAVLEDDAGYIDVEGADCIVQLGLFGEITYG